jgi:hypothetical protein
MKLNQQRLDASETAFFERQLTSIEARLYEVLFPERLLLSILKIDTSDGIGAEQFIYRIYEKIGMAQIIASYAAGDLPSVDVVGSEFTGRFYSYGNKFNYSIQEIRAASFANVPLEQWKADAAKLAHAQAWNQVAWFGDSKHNLQGLLTHPNVTKGYVATVSGHTEWTTPGTKTPDQINEDMSKLVRDIRTLSKNIEQAKILLMGIDRYGYISSTYRASNSDRTILEAFELAHPGLVVDSVPELDQCLIDPVTGSVSAGINVMVALDNDPMKGCIKGPIPFEMIAPAMSGMQYEIPCHSRFGGFVARYPLAFNIGVGI